MSQLNNYFIILILLITNCENKQYDKSNKPDSESCYLYHYNRAVEFSISENYKASLKSCNKALECSANHEDSVFVYSVMFMPLVFEKKYKKANELIPLMYDDVYFDIELDLARLNNRFFLEYYQENYEETINIGNNIIKLIGQKKKQSNGEEFLFSDIEYLNTILARIIISHALNNELNRANELLDQYEFLSEEVIMFKNKDYKLTDLLTEITKKL